VTYESAQQLMNIPTAIQAVSTRAVARLGACVVSPDAACDVPGSCIADARQQSYLEASLCKTHDETWYVLTWSMLIGVRCSGPTAALIEMVPLSCVAFAPVC
jgi:hypothetical protein